MKEQREKHSQDVPGKPGGGGPDTKTHGKATVNRRAGVSVDRWVSRAEESPESEHARRVGRPPAHQRGRAGRSQITHGNNPSPSWKKVTRILTALKNEL